MTKKNRKKGGLAAIIGVIFLTLTLMVVLLVVKKPQNIEEKAASVSCPGAEQCPNSKQPSLLQSCHPADGDGTTADSLCNVKGRIETCGAATRQYCCPAAGAAWTTNLTACATPVPTPTIAPTPTATPTPTTTPTNNTCLNPYLNSNPWDVNRDGTTNIIDIGIIIDFYGKSACVKPQADVDGRGTVDIVDIGKVIDNYVF